jgi:hypothetical protein
MSEVRERSLAEFKKRDVFTVDKGINGGRHRLLLRDDACVFAAL